MTTTGAVIFVIIIVLSVCTGTMWCALSSSRVKSGRPIGSIVTLNWVIAAAFAALGMAGAIIYFGSGTFSSLGWTMMICGGVVALVLAGHHVTLRKIGREVEERHVFASDL